MASNRPEIFRREKERESAAGPGVYRFPDKPFPHTMLIVFEEFSYSTGYNQGGEQEYVKGLLNASTGRRGRSSGIELRSQRAVELPFPKQLVDSTDISLNGFSRDPIAEKLMNGLDSLNATSGGALGGVAGGLQQLGADLSIALGSVMSGGGNLDTFKATLSSYGIDDVMGVTRYLLQKAAPVLGEFGQSLKLATGQVLNPKETLAFEGVGLRSHQFNWDLYPSNNADSDQIKRIVNIMKRSVLPTTKDFAIGDNGAGLSFERAFLKFPHIVKCYLIGVDQNAFTKFKPAMATNMSVDYGAAGQVAIMKGGKPAGVQISLSLQELSMQTAEDYGEESEPETRLTGVDLNRFQEKVTSRNTVTPATSDPEVEPEGPF